MSLQEVQAAVVHPTWLPFYANDHHVHKILAVVDGEVNEYLITGTQQDNEDFDVSSHCLAAEETGWKLISRELAQVIFDEATSPGHANREAYDRLTESSLYIGGYSIATNNRFPRLRKV